MPASPDPDLALRLAKALVDLYGGAALRLLQVVARRLARGIDQPGWAERKLLEVTALRDEAQGVVNGLVDAGPAVVAEAIEQAWRQGADDAEGDLTEGGLRAGLPDRRPTGVDALVTETVSQLTATHGPILRQVDDIFRQVITEATGPVVAGTETRRQAAQAALDRFVQRGITGFIDRAGRRWEVESYAEMATRTAAGRAQVAGALDRLSAAGRDLVIVSDAPQECPLCRPWEGRVLSISGGDPERPSVATAVAAGLLHANCRHSLAAWVPGLTRAPGRTADPEGDAARQEQRRLERGGRMWKRRAAVALDDQTRRRAEARAREWQARLREHVAANDLKRQPQRERLGAR